MVAAEQVREALFDAVWILAEQVKPNSRAGRNAREHARKLLEGQKITPPTTLGTSRERKSKKKRHQRKSLTKKR